jgi:hypothetical protein
MKPDYPFSAGSWEEKNQVQEPSRLTDEKMSDDTDAELKMDSALKPAGLSNPFWK